MKIGQVEISLLSDGIIRLDGGGMYGVVPRELWRRFAPPDRKNRVQVALNCLLIQSGGKNIVVDTGVGGKHPRQRRSLFAMTAGLLPAALKQHGLTPSDIDMVVLTHLHFDHAGGCTIKGPRGSLLPAFPRARHLVQRKDWLEATQTNERTRPAYLPQDFLPLEEHGQLELVDGSAQIAPGVSLRHVGGHTAGHQMVLVDSEGQKAACLGDVMPTHHHLAPHYVTAWDGYPMDTVQQKRKLLERAEAEDWTLFFGHDTQQRAGRVVRHNGRPTLVPVPWQ